MTLIPLAVLVAACPAFATVKFDSREMIRTHDVRPGMRGEGRTVFKGAKIESFGVTVLGVLPKQNLGGAYVLVRLSGGPISQRQANVMQGMSGSPIYIRGRLLGAVSATYPFGREPIALVTPIEDMLEALDPALPTKPPLSRKSPRVRATLGPQEWTLPKEVTVGGQPIRRVRLLPKASPGRGDAVKSGTLEMVPMSTPVMASGLSARNLRRLSEALEPFGLTAIAGPGAMPYDKPIDLQPGAAAAVSLAVGDVDLSAVGTITYRKGNQILAFGHSFLDAGAVDMPLCTAWVHDVVPSLYTSIRLASPVKMVGSVRQDRPWAVAALVGRMPEMIPVTVNVRDFGSKRRKTLRVQVVDDRFLTGQLISLVTNEAILRTHNGIGDATARVHTEIVTQELGPIRRENLYYDAAGIDVASLGDLITGLNLLNSNPWERVVVREVKVSVNIDAARRTAVIERAVAERDKYEPGDTVKVEVTLRPWEKDPVKRVLMLKIPEYAPNGRVTLRVQGGAGGGMIGGVATDQSGTPGGTSVRIGPPPLPPATSLKQLVEHYLERERNNELVGRLLLPTFTASIQGQKMRTLPPRLLEVMRSPRNSAVRLQPDEVKVAQPTPWVVSGMAVITLGIERHVYKEKGGPPAPAPSQPMPGPPGGPEPTRPAAGDDTGTEMGDLLWSRPGGVHRDVSAPSLLEVLPAEASRAETSAGTSSPTPPPEPKAPPSSQGEAKPGEADAKKPDDEKKAQEPAVKAVGRAPVVWRQNSAEAFSRGRQEGVAISSRGAVLLAPSLRKGVALDAPYIWALLAANGAIYAGTGDKGVLYRVADGKAEPVLQSGELQILALTKDEAGNVYAGTAPHGLVFRVRPDGSAGLFWRSPEEYILALTVDAQGNLYAGTSPRGRIYRITPDGKGVLFAQVADPYVVSLVAIGNEVFVGTSGDAGVFRITPDGAVHALFDPGEGTTSILLAPDQRGGLYAGTTPRGTIYHLDCEGNARVLCEKSAGAITALAEGGPGVVWAAAGSVLYRVLDTAPQPVVETIENVEAPPFLAVAVDESGVTLGSATGVLYRLSATIPQRGVFESAVRDAGSVARSGRITWIADAPAGTRVALQTRTGNSEQPDSTWSPWSPEYVQSGQTISSPPGRYLQYRILLESERPDLRPSVSEVAWVYLPHNREPKITVEAPKTGDAWSRKQTIRWSGSDPDKDTLLYNVMYSRDGGATWVKLTRVLKEESKEEPAPAAGKPSSSPPPAGGGKALESPPPGDTGSPKPPPNNAPPSPTPDAASGRPRSTAASSAPAPNPAGASSASPQPAAGSSQPSAEKKPEPKERKTDSFTETTYLWDTTTVPDGRYLIKVVASDRASNPANAHTVEQIVGPIFICNTPPRLTLANDPLVMPDRTVHLNGETAAGIPISGVDYRVDKAEWVSAAAQDGIFDSERERFEIRTPPLEAGEHTLEVRAVDAAGNHTEQSRKVTVR